MEDSLVSMTKLATVGFVSVNLTIEGSDLHVCDGELHVLKSPDDLVVLSVAPDFQYALDWRMKTVKAFDSTMYILPHSQAGDEITISVYSNDDDAILVLDYCLEISTQFSIQTGSIKGRAGRIIKKGAKKISMGIRKGISWAYRGLEYIKGKTTPTTGRDNLKAIQLIEEAQQNHFNQVIMPRASLEDLIQVAANVKSPANPDSLYYVLSQSASAVRSAISSSSSLVSEVKSTANEISVANIGMQLEEAKKLKEIGAAVKSSIEYMNTYRS